MKRQLKRPLKAILTTVTAATAAVALAFSGTAQAAATPGWRFAEVYPQSNWIGSVSASSSTNAWAVGQDGLTSTCDMCLFTAHWNGKKWQTIATPPGLLHQVNRLVGTTAVAATAANRAWVFAWGEYAELGTTLLSAVEWTGKSWSAVHNFPGSPSLSTAIASGPDDVWGFGATGSLGQTPWAVRYTGKRWSQVPIPVMVAAASGSAAAGDWVTGTAAGQPARIEVLRWSKGAWRNVPLPALRTPKGDLARPGLITAAGPASVWASVVDSSPTVERRVSTVLLHWNGETWAKVSVPTGVTVSGLASDGHGGLWVAAYTKNPPKGLPSGLAMYHDSSGRWTRVLAPVKPGFTASIDAGNMQLIPGTRSVLGNVDLFGATSIVGAILKYGP